MKVYRDDQRLLNFRINVFMWLIILGIAVLAGSFWYVQGVHAERFRGLSESNRLREISIPAQRGLILDRNGKIFVDNRPSYTLMLVRSDLARLEQSDPGHREQMIAFLSAALDLPASDIEKRITRHDEVPRNRAVPLVEELNIQQVSEVEAHRLSFPALSVTTVPRRHYRYSTMAAHVLGYIGESTPEDLDRDPDLQMGDILGKKGIELVYDDYLRGIDGNRLMIVDSHGQFLSEIEDTRLEAVSGENLYLTIDFDLQRRAEQYFFENEMVGTAVALDPRNGEILALVSSPAFDPNVYSKRLAPETWRLILSNSFKVELNRAIQGLYSPGSVFKPVMAMAALEKGVITADTSFNCRGQQTFFGRSFRCWKRGGHGDVKLEEALKISCDIYFYNLGALLGVDTIASYAKSLTFGERARIDLAGEKPGLVPTTAWARDVQKRSWYPSETISVSIGQGPLLVNPLQVANMMAAIANGGVVYRPHLVREIESKDKDGRLVHREIQQEVLHKIEIDQKALEVVRSGLWRAVNEIHGTAWSARVPGLDIAGKTGTAQVITQETWTKSQDLPYRFRDHAWFASFAPKDNPELVVVVFVEHGGHGGSEAAPLATEIYRAWFSERLARGGNLATRESLSNREERVQ